MDTNRKLEVVCADQPNLDLQGVIQNLCRKAFEEDLAPLFSTFKNATHVLDYPGSSLVSYALWVTRWLQAGIQPVMRTAYSEHVATEKDY